jgi:hypothetical protein
MYQNDDYQDKSTPEVSSLPREMTPFIPKPIAKISMQGKE